jgi:hypothetical protein
VAFWSNEFTEFVAAGKGLTEANCQFETKEGGEEMLETIAVVLIILWALGLVSSYTMGGLIHILLVVAIVVIVIRLLQGRGP